MVSPRMYCMYISRLPLSVLQNSIVQSTPSPWYASLSSLVEEMSVALVTTISLTEGAEDSRSAEAPVGLLMPRPTPHWKLLHSIQPSCPAAVTSPGRLL